MVYKAEELSLYHIWTESFSYLIKLRPFCAEFLNEMLDQYNIIFYTAAKRTYGILVLECLKKEMLAKFSSSFEGKEK